MDHQNPHGGLPTRLVHRPSTTETAAPELRKSLRGGDLHRALTRASARAALFEQPADQKQFEQVLAEARRQRDADSRLLPDFSPIPRGVPLV
jgi:hypothetical protein